MEPLELLTTLTVETEDLTQDEATQQMIRLSLASAPTESAIRAGAELVSLAAVHNADGRPEVAWTGDFHKMLLERLPVVSFMAHLDGGAGNEIYISPFIVDLLGYTKEQWLGNPILWYERLHPDDRSRWNVEFAKFLTMDEPFRSVYRFIARSGAVVWVHGDVQMVRDETGRPISVQGIGYDVTDLKVAESAVKQAHAELEQRTIELSATNVALEAEIVERKRSHEELQRKELQLVHSSKLAALGTLASGVAHELNQPLTVIRGLMQQAMHGGGLSAELAEDIELIVAQTARMTKIINHLRTFARSPSTSTEIVDLNQPVRDCLILIGEQLRAHGIRIELSLSDEPISVQADANEIEQVVLNLLTNARDELDGRSGAAVWLRSRKEDTSAILEIRDNGPGVPDTVADRIFDPFFTTKPAGKGTGLGLSISHSIIARFGGLLDYRTDNGAIFTITLPCVHHE